MNTQMFYLGAFALYGLASILDGWRSRGSLSVDASYEMDKPRRLLAKILLIAAAFSLGMGVLSQMASSYL